MKDHKARLGHVHVCRWLCHAANVMLGPPDRTIIATRTLVQLVAPIRGIAGDATPERIHLGGGHGNKPLGNAEILAKDVNGVDPADDRGDGQTERIPQTLLRRDEALSDDLAIASQRFHPECRNAKSVQCRKDFLLKATERAVEAVQRKLTGVEGKAMAEHLEMQCRIFVAGEPDEPDFSLLLGVQKRFGRPAGRKMTIRIVLVNDFVNLPEIQIVGP